MGLTVLHTLWMREHNRIESELHDLNPHWDGETLYQETRRIIGAMVQHITYREFLPIVLGAKQMKLFGLELVPDSYYTGYDHTVDVSITNVFATAAFRFGHSLLQASVQRADRKYNLQAHQAINLTRLMNRPASIYDIHEGGIDSIIRGLASQPAQQMDNHVTSQLTKHLFTETPPHGLGMDLISLNIQRGRDHGLPGYNAWREWCGRKRATNFDSLTDIKENLRGKFKSIYSSVDDIDLYVAGISEHPVSGGLVGPTFSCIIGKQFQNLRKGDRFWYENDGAFRFTPEQLASVRRVSLARVLCENGDNIDSIQPWVMERPFREVYTSKHQGSNKARDTGMNQDWFNRLWDSNYNARVPCQWIHSLDLTPWKQPQFTK